MYSLDLNMVEKNRIAIQVDLFKSNEFKFLHPDTDFPKKDQALTYLTSTMIRELAYGGAKGGGKSRVGTDWMVLSCLAYAGIKCFIARNELKRLRSSTYQTLLNTISDLKIPSWAWKFNGQDNVIHFYNGSSIDLLDFAYVPRDPMFERFGSQEYTYGWLEEGGEIDSGAYEMAKIIIGRQPNIEEKYGITAKLYISLNPKKNWVYHSFYLPHREGTLDAQTVYLPVLAHENPYNTADYLKSLDEIKDPVQRARLRDGKWEYEDSEKALFNYNDVISMFNGENTVIDGDWFITNDPSRKGKDFCTIYLWRGYVIKRIYVAQRVTVDLIVEMIKYIENEVQCQRNHVIVDDDGLGGGVVDYLPNCTAFVNNKEPFDEGERIQKFRNLKTQTYKKFADAVKNKQVVFDKDFEVLKFGEFEGVIGKRLVQEYVIAELEAIMIESDMEDKYFEITKKKDIKKTIKRSPDFADGMMMRFIFDIAGSVFANLEYRSANVPHSYDKDDKMFDDFVQGIDNYFVRG